MPGPGNKLRNSRSSGKKSHIMDLSRIGRFSVAMKWLTVSAGWLTLVGASWSADDPGARAVQQQLLQRQQQQEALQLRMQQQQRAVQSPPADARQNQAREKMQIEQQQQQQALHYRQGIEPQPAQPADDEGTRRAKAEMERLRAQRESQEQARRFEREMQQEPPK